MSQFELHTPEENDAERFAWRTSFEEASEMPPARVWDAIERRLDDEDESGIIPLWGSTPASGAGATAGGLAQGGAQIIRPWVRWSAAAAVALVVGSIGWWSLQSDKPTTIASTSVADRVARTEQAPAPSGQTQKTPNTASSSVAITDGQSKLSTGGVDKLNNQQSDYKIQPENSLARPELDRSPGGHQLALNEKANKPTSALRRPIKSPESLAAMSRTQSKPVNESIGDKPGHDQKSEVIAPSSNAEQAPVVVSRISDESRNSNSTNSVAEIQSPNRVQDQPVAAQTVVAQSVAIENAGSIVPFTDIESLESPTIQANLHETQRIVWFRAPDTEPVEIETSRPASKRELWASASVMPSSFNPAVALQSAPAATVYTNYVPNTTVRSTSGNGLVNSQANLSMAYQLATGLQLGSHWSVETGVGYLEARSTVDSPVQTIIPSMAAAALPGAKTSNLYVDALRTSNGSLNSVSYDKNGQSFIANANIYNAAQTQVVRNDYQFVQVPVQVGYQFRPRKRLGMALLGGLLTNWFVRNRVADELAITVQDGVYRPLTLSATTGLRFRYRPTQRWSASLAGIYQHALQNGTESTVGVEVHPRTIGVSMGVDYHF